MESRQTLVEGFERTIGCRLPDEYRDYLLAGPVPVWTDEEQSENPYTMVLHSLHDFASATDDITLGSAWEYRAELPAWFLQIGEVYDGVKIGIGLSGPQVGRVFSFSWDDGEEKEIAPSFNAFLKENRQQEAKWSQRRRR